MHPEMITLECNCHSGCALGHVRVSRKFRLADECRLCKIRLHSPGRLQQGSSTHTHTHTRPAGAGRGGTLAIRPTAAPGLVVVVEGVRCHQRSRGGGGAAVTGEVLAPGMLTWRTRVESETRPAAEQLCCACPGRAMQSPIREQASRDPSPQRREEKRSEAFRMAA